MPRNLYEQKLELFQKLGQISGEMAAFTSERLINEEGAAEEFQDLLQLRETIMNEVDQLTTQIKKLENGAVPELEDLTIAIRAEGAKIETHNQTIEAVVKTALDELREKTKKAQEGRQSSRAYDTRIPAGEGAFIDKRR